jgi:hypothetical protein
MRLIVNQEITDSNSVCSAHKRSIMTDKEMFDLKMSGHKYADIAVTAKISETQVMLAVSREIDKLRK